MRLRQEMSDGAPFCEIADARHKANVKTQQAVENRVSGTVLPEMRSVVAANLPSVFRISC